MRAVVILVLIGCIGIILLAAASCDAATSRAISITADASNYAIGEVNQ